MSNPICWLCNVNPVYREYKESKLLDEQGDKPCFECFLEDKDIEEDDNEF